MILNLSSALVINRKNASFPYHVAPCMNTEIYHKSYHPVKLHVPLSWSDASSCKIKELLSMFSGSSTFLLDLEVD